MKKIFIMLSILSFAYAQNGEKLFSQESSNFNNNQLQLNRNVDFTNLENLK